MRINKYVALATGMSRRAADIALADKRVTINGAPSQIGQDVDHNDRVLLDTKHIQIKTVAFQTILLNKPYGYVCSRDGQNSKTVYDLLPKELHQLKTVGRLDRNSTGLLLLTNDGVLNQKLTHPRYKKIKKYQVELDKNLEPLHHQMINDIGVHLEDGNSKLVLQRHFQNDNKHWVVEMSEGRNRQIRRTFESIGYKVLKLHRISFGPYVLQDIPSGKYVVMTHQP
ncbi:MAG: pseudouridine synthase [Candidatus Saccharimonadales bacterium]